MATQQHFWQLLESGNVNRDDGGGGGEVCEGDAVPFPLSSPISSLTSPPPPPSRISKLAFDVIRFLGCVSSKTLDLLPLVWRIPALRSGLLRHFLSRGSLYRDLFWSSSSSSSSLEEKGSWDRQEAGHWKGGGVLLIIRDFLTSPLHQGALPVRAVIDGMLLAFIFFCLLGW